MKLNHRQQLCRSLGRKCQFCQELDFLKEYVVKNILLLLALLAGSVVQAQDCEGGLYLNPQVIRGEVTARTDITMRELIAFIRPSRLSVSPMTNIKETQDVLVAIQRRVPPCWVYGNPVVGLKSRFRPVAVNIEPIQSAVLILSDLGSVKDAKPVDVEKLPATEQARVLAKLKTSACFGIKSGVTTALVMSEKLCGEVIEVLPQHGLGQNFLPTKAAFQWQANKWVGLITRVSSAHSANMQNQFGTDERVHYAKLLVVPTRNASWGYGLYVHPSVPTDAIRRVSALFAALKNPSASLVRALDIGEKYEFATPSEAATNAMIKSLEIGS
ncbi:MAG: hypothetical protein WCH44_15945 [Betaproteobacteria bacterium]